MTAPSDDFAALTEQALAQEAVGWGATTVAEMRAAVRNGADECWEDYRVQVTPQSARSALESLLRDAVGYGYAAGYRVAVAAERERWREVVEQAHEHVSELRDAWARGCISEHDAKGGTRSTRNVDVEVALRRALEAVVKEAQL